MNNDSLSQYDYAFLQKNYNSEKLQRLGIAVIELEAQAVTNLKSRIDDNFAIACSYLLECKGRIIVMGIGKSGHIGNKIASTLASTGSPAFFVHPGEASHGDLGMITANDVILALSNSGNTEEIITILPLIKRLGIPLITLTGNQESVLARNATVNINVGVTQEACPLGLVPTASTTAALVMGDALAISLLEARGFTAKDFAFSHPGGSLGRRLLLRIDDLMHTGDGIPCVLDKVKISQALVEMSRKGLGMTAVINENDNVVGIFTDGDLRRTLDHELDIHKIGIAEVMTRNFRYISPGLLAAEALRLMESYKINALLVINDQNQLVGAINMHDLLRARVI